jgi:DNA mismatch repair protein MutS
MDLTQNKEMTIEEKMEQLEKYELGNEMSEKKIQMLFNTSNISNTSPIYSDLEIFTDYDNNSDNSIFSKLNKTKTLYGKVKLQDLLKKPTSNIYELEEKQEYIKFLNENTKSISDTLSEIENNEHKINWFWNDIDDNVKSLYEIVYFNIPYFSDMNNMINTNKPFMQISNLYKIILSPIITIFTPLMCIIIPFIIARVFKIKIPILEFISTFKKNLTKIPSMATGAMGNIGGSMSYMTMSIWFMVYLQNSYSTFMSAKHSYKVINIIHRKINVVSNIVKCCDKLSQYAKNLNTNITNDLNYFKKLFKAKEFSTSPKLISNKGEILATYYEFLENKERLIPLLEYIGEIDCYHSIACLDGYTFTKYNTKSKKPIIDFVGIKHPFFNNKKAIPNDIKIKTDMLITGPNAAGKSTFIKSIALGVLMSQTFGICYAKDATVTPFENIDTYLQIKDTKGKESLFEAQMNRCEEYLLKVKNMNPSKFNFIAMDEIFTSTNTREGYSAAYAITKKLSSINNTRVIITTHFTKLSKLQKITKNKIKNYKFCISRNENGDISYPYKIKKGVSKEYIALELLSKKNFEKEIIDDAMNNFNNV